MEDYLWDRILESKADKIYVENFKITKENLEDSMFRAIVNKMVKEYDGKPAHYNIRLESRHLTLIMLTFLS